jgi:TolA-binding protein
MKSIFRIGLFALMLMAPTIYAQEAAPTVIVTETTASAADLEFDAKCFELQKQENSLEAQIKDLQIKKAQLAQTKTSNVRIQYEKEDSDYLKAIAEIEHQNALCKAECERDASLKKAELSSKHKTKWEAVFPTEVTRRCSDTIR